MFSTCLKISIRNVLKKLPLLTVLNIISVPITMLAVIFIAMWVKDELDYDNRITMADRLYRLTVEVSDPEHGLHSNFARCYQAWPNTIKTEFPEIEEVIRISAIQDNIVKIAEEKLFVRFHQVDSSFFRIFNIPLMIGNSSSVFAQQQNVVLSEKIAKKLFGNGNPLGKRIQMYCQNCTEKREYQVSGIMKDIPPNSHFHLDIAGAFPPLQGEFDDWAYYYILLKKGCYPGQLMAKFPAFFKKNNAENEYRISKINLQPVRDIHLKSSKDSELDQNGSMSGIWVFVGIAAFVLSISIINFFNLRMAGMFTQLKTARTMKVFGASNLHIIGQNAIELMVIISASMFFSVVGFESLLSTF